MKTRSKKIINKNEPSSVMAIPREQWEKHFEAAIKAGHLPDKAKEKIFSNHFDESGWTW